MKPKFMCLSKFSMSVTLKYKFCAYLAQENLIVGIFLSMVALTAVETSAESNMFFGVHLLLS